MTSPMRTAIPNTTNAAPCHLVEVIGRQGNRLCCHCIDACEVHQHGDAEKDEHKTETHRDAPNRPEENLGRQRGSGEPADRTFADS